MCGKTSFSFTPIANLLRPMPMGRKLAMVIHNNLGQDQEAAGLLREPHPSRLLTESQEAAGVRRLRHG